MAIIIGKDEVYNLYSTIVDVPLFESGLNKEMLEFHIKEEYGNEGLKDLPRKLERVNQYGTSSRVDNILKDTVHIFLTNTNITLEEFISTYLKIKES